MAVQYVTLCSGQVSSVLAWRALRSLSVFCRRPAGTVQHAAVRLERV